MKKKRKEKVQIQTKHNYALNSRAEHKESTTNATSFFYRHVEITVVHEVKIKSRIIPAVHNITELKSSTRPSSTERTLEC